MMMRRSWTVSVVWQYEDFFCAALMESLFPIKPNVVLYCSPLLPVYKQSEVWVLVLSVVNVCLEAAFKRNSWQRFGFSVCLSFTCRNQPFVARWFTGSQARDEIVSFCDFSAARRDHRRPGRWHGDHPRVRPHLPSSWTAPPADPDFAVHGGCCIICTSLDESVKEYTDWSESNRESYVLDTRVWRKSQQQFGATTDGWLCVWSSCVTSFV